MNKVATVAVTSIALALGTFFLYGCASHDASYTIDEGTITIEDKTLTVELSGNPTTGYAWTSTTEGPLVNDEGTYEQDKQSGNEEAVGVGGTYTFVYACPTEGQASLNNEGESTITLTYARSWEQSSDDITVTIKVNTDSAGVITSTETVSSAGSKGYSK